MALRVAALDALTVAATTLGPHRLAFVTASALNLAIATTALLLGHAAFTATATTLDSLRASFTAAATLRLSLTTSTATLCFGLSATAALSLSLTVTTPVRFGRCRRGNRKCRDTGR
jgi:hypothetical protein